MSWTWLLVLVIPALEGEEEVDPCAGHQLGHRDFEAILGDRVKTPSLKYPEEKREAIATQRNHS